MTASDEGPAITLVDLFEDQQQEIDRLTRELSEARAALVKAEGERDHNHKLFIEMCDESDRVWEVLGDCGDDEIWEAVAKLEARAFAAQAACRSHAEAIGVLREALGNIRDLRDSDGADPLSEAIDMAEEALANPVATQLERERRAEREVVRAAQTAFAAGIAESNLTHDRVDCGMDQDVIEAGRVLNNAMAELWAKVAALAALPASPSSDT